MGEQQIAAIETSSALPHDIRSLGVLHFNPLHRTLISQTPFPHFDFRRRSIDPILRTFTRHLILARHVASYRHRQRSCLPARRQGGAEGRSQVQIPQGE